MLVATAGHEELLDPDPLMLEPVIEVVDPLPELFGHQHVGNVLGHQFDQRVDALLLEGHLGLHDPHLLQPRW